MFGHVIGTYRPSRNSHLCASIGGGTLKSTTVPQDSSASASSFDLQAVFPAVLQLRCGGIVGAPSRAAAAALLVCNGVLGMDGVRVQKSPLVRSALAEVVQGPASSGAGADVTGSWDEPPSKSASATASLLSVLQVPPITCSSSEAEAKSAEIPGCRELVGSGAAGMSPESTTVELLSVDNNRVPSVLEGVFEELRWKRDIIRIRAVRISSTWLVPVCSAGGVDNKGSQLDFVDFSSGFIADNASDRETLRPPGRQRDTVPAIQKCGPASQAI
jgi:hypothetical protein